MYIHQQRQTSYVLIQTWKALSDKKVKTDCENLIIDILCHL